MITPNALQLIASEKISDPRFSQFDLYIQDESTNPTGTHKYYLGISVLKLYKEVISNRLANKDYSALPQLTMYSSGNGAYSIGWALKKCGLPCLKTVVAPGTSEQIKHNLHRIGCEVFPAPNTDWIHDLLAFTNNADGIDFEHYKKEHALTAYETLISNLMQGHQNREPDILCMPYGLKLEP